MEKYLKKAKNLLRLRRPILKWAGISILFIVFLLGLYTSYFWERIYPNTYVAGVNLGTKTQAEAQKELVDNIKAPNQLELKSENQTFSIDLATIDFSYDYEASVNTAYTHHRTGNYFYDFYLRLIAPFGKTNLSLRADFDEEKLEENLSVIAGQVALEPVYPEASLENGVLVIENGRPGQDIDKEKIREEIRKTLAFADFKTIEIKTTKVSPELTDAEAEKFRQRAEKVLGKNLTLVFETQTITLNQSDILSLLEAHGEYKDSKLDEIVEDVASSVERDPQNPIFVFEDGRVKEFAPSKDGVALKKDTLKERIIGNLRTLESTEEKTASINIPVERAEAKIKTEEVNNLGINELLGRGTSTYRGSIASRVHNIGVASAKYNGVLVKPGEVFSFNEVLGDVSAYTGYQQAYIIKDGKTVLGDGGGVCQVSTTLFRAVLDAGLPIVERRAHSYRVGYYEQDSPPGFDATIYSPITDLKFKNDTPNHLLIQTLYEPARSFLAFEIYGTDDGRVASTTKPIVSNVTAPPEDKYVDDPSLPAGTVKQIEYRAWGATVTFDYTVTKNGETLYEKTFYSNYKPWQAIYLRGTGPTN